MEPLQPKPDGVQRPEPRSTQRPRPHHRAIRLYIAGSLDFVGKLRLCCRHPFEQVPMRDKQSAEGPQNRVSHQPRLVCQKCKRQADLGCAERQVAEHAAKMASQGNTSSTRDESDEKWQECRNRNGRENE